jgi:paraquat-inducible protein B
VNAPESLEEIPTASAHTSRRARLPLVWVVPVIAALIGGWIAARAILEHGPTITVTFSDAEGIEAGKTRVRYRNVDVGQVTRVTLADELHTVMVSIQMERVVEPFLLAGTQFWVVRPHLAAAGVSGLGTLLSGDFIGMDVGPGPGAARSFIGLKAPPIVTGDAGGTRLFLDATDLGSLSVGAPAYFHHVPVGEVVSSVLNSDGHGVTLQLFIEKPYDRFLTDDTRFWHASGVDIAVDSAGVRVRTEAVATILAGGVAFDNPMGSGPAARFSSNRHFRLAANRDEALRPVDGVVERHVLYFQESLRGLAVGAAVDFRGVEIGTVVAKESRFDRASGQFELPVLIDIYPGRLLGGAQLSRDLPSGFQPVLADMIRHGLRAQLRTGSVLTGQLYVALDFFPQTGKATPQPDAVPMPIPTTLGNLEQLQEGVLSVTRKLQKLPLDKVGDDADAALIALAKALSGTDVLIGNVNAGLLPETQSAMAQARRTLSQTGQAIAPGASLQSDLHTTLTSVGRAADSVRVLAEYLDRHPESLLQGKTKDPK